MTNQEQIQALAKRHRVGVFFDQRARRDGQPWIVIKKNGMWLGAFHDEADAISWFPARADAQRANHEQPA